MWWLKDKETEQWDIVLVVGDVCLSRRFIDCQLKTPQILVGAGHPDSG
jgi:hypothetical protein